MRIRNLTLSLLLASAAFPLFAQVGPPVSPPAAPPSTQPQSAELDQYQKEIEETLADARKELIDLPSLPARKPGEVLSFRYFGNDIVIASPLPSTFEPTTSNLEARIELLGLTPIAKVEVSRAGQIEGDTKGEVPNNFKIVFLQPTSSGFVRTELFSNVLTGQFQAVRNTLDASGSVDVQLIQLPRETADESELFRLYVSRAGRDGTQLERFSVAAPSFPELRRLFPEATNRYLRPIFKDLGQESPLFSVDLNSAWQVLGGKPEDPQLDAQVKAILTRLDSDDFKTREDAQKQLQALGHPAALLLRDIDRSRLTPQQSSEIDGFLAQLHSLSPEQLEELQSSRDYLLDCMELDILSLRQAAWTRLSKLLPAPPPTSSPATTPSPVPIFDPSAEPSVREKQITQLRAMIASLQENPGR